MAIIWSLLILVLLSIPGTNVPSLSIWDYDKVGHAGMFFILVLFWMNAVAAKSLRAMSLIVICGVLLAPLSEVYQSVLPFGRQGDINDALADVAGVVLAAIVWRALYTRKKKTIDTV